MSEVCTMRWDQERKNSGKWENEQVTAAAASEEGFFPFLHYFHTLIIVSWTWRKTIFHNWRKEEQEQREMEIFQHFILKKLQIFWAYVLNALNISYTWEGRVWREVCGEEFFCGDGEMKWKWQELKIVWSFVFTSPTRQLSHKKFLCVNVSQGNAFQLKSRYFHFAEKTSSTFCSMEESEVISDIETRVKRYLKMQRWWPT